MITAAGTIDLSSTLAMEAGRRQHRRRGLVTLGVAVVAGAATALGLREGTPVSLRATAALVRLAGAAQAIAVYELQLGVAYAGKMGWALARRTARDPVAFDRVNRWSTFSGLRIRVVAAVALALGVLAAIPDETPRRVLVTLSADALCVREIRAHTLVVALSLAGASAVAAVAALMR